MTYKGIKNRLDLFLLQNPFKRGMKRSGFSNLLIFFFLPLEISGTLSPSSLFLLDVSDVS